MPLKTPSQVSTIAEYKKLIQADARNLTATGSKFHYFKKFTLGDKTTGPAFFLGTIDSTLLGTITKQGTGLAMGQATINDNDEITLEVASGDVAYGGLSKALKGWGVTRVLHIPPGAEGEESSSEEVDLSKTVLPKLPPTPQRQRGALNPGNRVGPNPGVQPTVRPTQPGAQGPTTGPRPMPPGPGIRPTPQGPGLKPIPTRSPIGQRQVPIRPPGTGQTGQPGQTAPNPQAQGGTQPTPKTTPPNVTAPKPGPGQTPTRPTNLPPLPATPKKVFDDRLKVLKPLYEKAAQGAIGGTLTPIYNGMLVKAKANDFAGALADAGKLEVAMNKAEFAEKKGVKQTRRAAKLVDTFTAMKKNVFPAGTSDALSKDKSLVAGKHFKSFLAAQKVCETTRDAKTLGDLEKAADEYREHFEKDFNDREKKKPENLRKLALCDSALKSARQYRMITEHEKLGPLPWDEEKEEKAAELYAQTLFEQEDGKMAAPNADAGVIGSWWVEKTVADADSGNKQMKKTFIFKPSDAETRVNGFPRGGSAAREIMGKAISDQVSAMTGLDFGTPETELITVNGASLKGTNGKPGKPWPRTGSIQHFAKSDGEMRKADPAALKLIPDEEVQKLAVLDLIQLNMDRHDGNFMIGDDGKGGKRLTPIDHGLVMPSRDGLGARRARLGRPAHALSRMPGADKKLSPEMVEKIKQIDPDEIIAALKKKQAAMAKLHPGATMAAGVTDENYKLMKRSIQFLKKASTELTLAEIQDAYVVSLEKIFDSADNQMDSGFDDAIQVAKARTPLHAEADKILDDFDKNQAIFEGLGWGLSFGLNYTNWQRWVMMNPEKTVKILKNKTVNPAVQATIQKLQAEIQRLDPTVDPKTLVAPSPALDKQVDFLKKKQQAALLAKAKTLGVDKPSEFRDLPLMEAYEGMGGAANLQGMDSTAHKLPLKDQVELMAKIEFQRMGGEKEMNRILPQLPGNVGKTIIEQAEALRFWKEYEKRGGNREYERLGCNEDVTGLRERIAIMEAASEISAIN